MCLIELLSWSWTKPGSSLRAESSLSAVPSLQNIILIYISLSLKGLRYFIIYPIQLHLVWLVKCIVISPKMLVFNSLLLCQVATYLFSYLIVSQIQERAPLLPALPFPISETLWHYDFKVQSSVMTCVFKSSTRGRGR